MCFKTATTFGQLPFFSYFCSRYDNTERLLQYYFIHMDNLRTIDLFNDALYSFSCPRISSEYNPCIYYGIFTLFLQSAFQSYRTW